MRTINLKLFITITVFFGIVIWIILLQRANITPGLEYEALKKVPSAVSIEMIFIVLFTTWGWKLPMFQRWLVPFPVLHGTWKGELRSTWIDPDTKQTVDAIPAYLAIRQTFLSVTYRLFTAEGDSRSYAVSYLLDREDKSKQVVFSYSNTPRVSVHHRSNAHDGTAYLEIRTKPRRELVGQYWTNRNTKGEMQMRFQKKELIESFPKS